MFKNVSQLFLITFKLNQTFRVNQMVFDLPTKDDFYTMGNSLLHSAWSHLIRIIQGYTEYLEIVQDENLRTKYIQHHQPELMSSFILVQQAVEFFLKGKIAAISPYLLIANEGRNWPKSAHKADISFLEFRTIDAQDLVVIHNTFSHEKLDDSFNVWFNEMRNKFVHSVSSKNQIEPRDLAITILRAHEYIFGPMKWIASLFNYDVKSFSNRYDFISEEEKEGYRYFYVNKEISLVIGELSPASAKKYFGYNKKQKSMECNFCESKFRNIGFYDHGRWRDNLVDTLLQSSNSKTSFTCFICNNTLEVFNASCIDCRETKLNVADGQCVWCDSH